MQGATEFIEVCKDDITGRYIQYPLSDISRLKKNLEATVRINNLRTVYVWEFKPKTILITGEEINGQSVLIAEKI